jgi:uncharacterized protein (TIGR03435 family)
MKQDEKTVVEIMNRVLGRHSRPPAEQVESASDRVWQRVQNRRSNGTSDVLSIDAPVHIHSRRRVLLPAFAAIAAITVLAVFLSGPVKEESAPKFAAGPIRIGDVVRSGDREGSVFSLEDGSRIEMRAKSELRVEKADDGVRIRLDRGGVIVTAAKQRMGHLYVQTKDVTVSVVGTVFFVNAEEEGSRVAVIQGEVKVLQGAVTKKLLPGEQVASNPLMESHPVSEEIAWSRSAEMHLALLEQSRPAAPAPLKFDAASIKPDPRQSPGLHGPVLCRGIDGVFSSMSGPGEVGAPPSRGPLSNDYPAIVPLGRCVGRHTELVDLIAAAYGVHSQNISGGPEWTGVYRAPSEDFQLVASSENPASTTKEQLRQMIQTLLADRFKLKVRREPKQSQGFALVVANGGLKINKAEGAEERFGVVNTGNGVRTISGKGSISAFVSFLEGCPMAGTPGLDKTELVGIYDFKLTVNFIPAGLPAPPTPGGPARPSCTSANRGQYDPPLAKSLEEQLGLRMQSQTVPEDFIVIEYAEKPSEN